MGKNLKKGPVFKSPKFPTFSGNLENSTESRKNLVIWLKYTFVNNVQAGTCVQPSWKTDVLKTCSTFHKFQKKLSQKSRKWPGKKSETKAKNNQTSENPANYQRRKGKSEKQWKSEKPRAWNKQNKKSQQSHQKQFKNQLKTSKNNLKPIKPQKQNKTEKDVPVNKKKKKNKVFVK